MLQMRTHWAIYHPPSVHQAVIQCYILCINCYSVLHSVCQMLFSATFCGSNCYSVLHSVHQIAIHGLKSNLIINRFVVFSFHYFYFHDVLNLCCIISYCVLRYVSIFIITSVICALVFVPYPLCGFVASWVL